MPEINFSFSGYVYGAKITKATSTVTGEQVDVSNVSAEDLIAKLNSGELSISLGDYLYANRSKADIEMFNYTE